MSESMVEIEGGRSLNGEVSLSGAKNAALPLLVAACLTDEPIVLENVPIGLNDVKVMIELLQAMGAEIHQEGNSTIICSRGTLQGGEVPAELANKIRYSLLLLGFFAGLRQEVYLSHPGGCNIGDRKYDLHLMGLQKLGASIEETETSITLKSKGLEGTLIDFYLPTTSGTENIMIAASLAKGTTILRNANTRPEVQQLGNLLRQMGAKVKVQSRVVEITGVDKLRGGFRFSIMPGWDEAVTYIAAAGITRGEVVILDFDLDHIPEEARYLREAGLELFQWQRNVYVSGKRVGRPFDLFTAPYPGVNSDMQPIFAALALTIPGTSTITDLRFTDRFQYVEELKHFGANIESFGNTAIVTGGGHLIGAEVKATDIRGGMACVMVGLAAKGITRIANVYQIERGYENFVEKFTALGAEIRRIER